MGISPPGHLIFGINEDSGIGTIGALPSGKNKDRMDGITGRGKIAKPL